MNLHHGRVEMQLRDKHPLDLLRRRSRGEHVQVVVRASRRDRRSGERVLQNVLHFLQRHAVAKNLDEARCPSRKRDIALGVNRRHVASLAHTLPLVTLQEVLGADRIAHRHNRSLVDELSVLDAKCAAPAGFAYGADALRHEVGSDGGHHPGCLGLAVSLAESKSAFLGKKGEFAPESGWKRAAGKEESLERREVALEEP